MELAELVRAAGVPAELRGDGTAEISKLAYDSRAVEAGTLFFCVRGMSSDGHEFAPGAVEAGASALVVERPLDLGVPEVEVADARAAMAPLAAAFHGDPTMELALVGVTGTNGKTTTAFLVRSLLEAAGRRCGLLGTVQRVVGGEVEEVERTTPEAIDLQATFARMLEAGDQACVMEVSSHALVLHRADAIHFDVKVFTNLTQDHLDFHDRHGGLLRGQAAAVHAPRAARRCWRSRAAISVVNVDDDYGRRLADELVEERSDEALLTFSASGADADLSAREVSFDASGASFAATTPAGELQVRTPLPGHFNVENALAALGAAHALGFDLADAAEALASARPSPRALRADRRGAAVHGAGRLRAHAGLDGERAARRAAADRGAPDLGLRRPAATGTATSAR